MSGRRSALIVATSQYKDGRLASLEGPARDADALRAVLADREIGGFEVRVALNSRVDPLRRTLESFFADRARDDLLLVHFSCHGLKDDDGQLYLAAADTQIDRLLSTGIDASWVNRMMNRCRSEKIALFLDCCFAGAFTSGMARRVGVDAAGVNEHFGGSGLFVIAASDAMQYAFEAGRQVGQPPEPSPFTRALVDGLQSGEADRNEDGYVSINELFDYLEDRIRETSPSQTPTKSAFNQIGDWAIARSTRVPSVRLLPEELQRQLKSEDALDRFSALIDLREIVRGSDARLGEAARQALRRLTQDDSRRVAAAAQRLLDEDVVGRRPGRTARRTAAAPAETAATTIAPPAEPAAPAAEHAAPGPAEPAAPAPAAAAEPIVEPPAPPEPAVPGPAEPAAPAPVAAAEPVAEPSFEGPTAPSTEVPLGPATLPPAAGPAAAPLVTSPVTPAVASPIAPAWTPPLPAIQPPVATSPGSAVSTGSAEPDGDRDWSLGRTATRAAIGTFVSVMLLYGWVLAANPWVLNDPSTLDTANGAVTVIALAATVCATLVVVLAERALPALRLPNGAFYRVVGGNRWLAAALLGLVVGLTVLPIAVYAYQPDPHFVQGAEMPICSSIAYVFAELLAGRWFTSKHEEGALAR